VPAQVQTPTRRRSSTTAKPSSAPKRKSAPRSASVKSETDTAIAAPDETTRHQMISVAAYFRAQQRGFAAGDPLQDWVQAEAEIAQIFSR
jgi:hypothetical protein